MDGRDVGRYWESNAHAWITLSRQGWDVYRDALNTPASITHPCFFPPHRRQVRNEHGQPYAVELGRYFDRIDVKASLDRTSETLR